MFKRNALARAIRDWIAFRTELLITAWKFRGAAFACVASLHFLNFKLRRKHWAKVGQYRLLGQTFFYEDVGSLEHLLTEHVAANVNFFIADRPDPVILDVGGNVGDTVLYFKQLYPESRIFSFEPIRRAFELLTKNVEANGFRDVRIFNEALGDRDGTLDLHVIPGHFLGATGFKDLHELDAAAAGKGVVEKVPIRRISARVAELGIGHIDLLKIDIEGGETALLRDAESVLRMTDAVSIEYHITEPDADNSFDAIVAILKRAGFDPGTFSTYRTASNQVQNPGVFMIEGRKRRMV